MASPSRRRATKRRRSSITELAFHGIHTSRLQKSEKCNPCVRYEMSPMSRAAHPVAQGFLALAQNLSHTISQLVREMSRFAARTEPGDHRAKGSVVFKIAAQAIRNYSLPA